MRQSSPLLLPVARRLVAAAVRCSSRYGIYLLSLWVVMTIAAIGLNLTLGYAGQISLAQGAFVGIGAYAAALLTTHGLAARGRPSCSRSRSAS